MRITADTNLLLRAVLNDDPAQAEAAHRILEQASLVAIPVAIFCELAWVLKRTYRQTDSKIATVINRYATSLGVVTDIAAVEAGLATLALGGDFADGAMAHQGREAGGDVFATFDKTAIRLITSLGYSAVSP